MLAYGAVKRTTAPYLQGVEKTLWVLISVKTPHWWNELPNEVRTAESLAFFHLRIHLNNPFWHLIISCLYYSTEHALSYLFTRDALQILDDILLLLLRGLKALGSCFGQINVMKSSTHESFIYFPSSPRLSHYISKKEKKKGSVVRR